MPILLSSAHWLSRGLGMSDDIATQAQVRAGPLRPVLDPNDPRTTLREGVKAALRALPGEFSHPHPISGVDATDLFSLNSFLGSGIELEVVRTLNALRTIWDPRSEWSNYRFERSAQSFPDVRLVNRGIQGVPIALGIELKGWWMLAKEGVPSLRYLVSADACTRWDLVCCVPWHLSSAVSGEAVVVEPWVESAKYAALWRDYWWTQVRVTKGDSTIVQPVDPRPYPAKADSVNVVASQDTGGNFGRLPRCRPLMDDFVDATMRVPIVGIEARAWVHFLKVHTESVGSDAVIRQLQRQLRGMDKQVAPERAEQILTRVRELVGLLP